MKHLKKKCLSLFFLLFLLPKNKPLLLLQLSSCPRSQSSFSQGDAEKCVLACSYYADCFLLPAPCVCVCVCVCVCRGRVDALILQFPGSAGLDQSPGKPVGWTMRSLSPATWQAFPSSLSFIPRSPPPLGKSCWDLQGRTGKLSVNTGQWGWWPALSREAGGLFLSDALSGVGGLVFEWEGKRQCLEIL